jgi:predicted metal-dependent hydrolase
MESTVENIKVRNVTFEFDKVPKHWILNNSVATHFVNSMHIVFPEGEKFFIRSVRRFAKDVKSEQLKKDIKGFCGQEGIHAREHERFWDVMEEQNLKPEGFAKFLASTAFKGKYSVENVLVKNLNKISPRLGDKLGLSITVGLEHYTAILANALFHEPIASNENIAPQMLELLHWHASEEMEHKSVCFDVLKEVDDSYILRISGMGVATLMLWTYLGVGQIYFLYQDKDSTIIKLPQKSYNFVDQLVLGEIGKGLSKNLFKYFKKDFHPKDIDDQYLIDKFFSNKTYA